MSVTPPPCGTPEGYRWHCGHGEERDQACKDAIAVYNRARRRGETPPKWVRTSSPAACGTLAAAKRHERRGEALDEACRAARAAKDRSRQSVLCACGCGELTRIGKGSLPSGEAMRQECRKRLGRPNVRRLPVPVPTVERRCLVCDEPMLLATWGRPRLYCDMTCQLAAAELQGAGGDLMRWRLAHGEALAAMLARAVAYRQSAKAETRTTRYGMAHRAERERRIAELDPAVLCPRCLEPLGEDPAVLDLDHDDEDPTRYLGLSHAVCNRSRRPVRLPVQAVA